MSEYLNTFHFVPENVEFDMGCLTRNVVTIHKNLHAKQGLVYTLFSDSQRGLFFEVTEIIPDGNDFRTKTTEAKGLEHCSLQQALGFILDKNHNIAPNTHARIITSLNDALDICKSPSVATREEDGLFASITLGGESADIYSISSPST